MQRFHLNQSQNQIKVLSMICKTKLQVQGEAIQKSSIPAAWIV